MAKPGPGSGFHKILHPKKRAVLKAYVAHVHVGQACTTARIDRTMHYHWLKTDPDYAEAFEEAKGMAAEVLEDEASRRAMGFDETRYTQDGTPYPIRKYSDTLLIVRLKAVKPALYATQQQKVGFEPQTLEALAQMLATLSTQDRQTLHGLLTPNGTAPPALLPHEEA